mmetsp:Transcript_66565/g.192188  ORF Transcript_66565/g.192188 Transcript_66565/m.192188 type:complete len:216 (-) Transcript_66565:826-1473(-)
MSSLSLPSCRCATKASGATACNKLASSVADPASSATAAWTSPASAKTAAPDPSQYAFKPPLTSLMCSSQVALQLGPLPRISQRWSQYQPLRLQGIGAGVGAGVDIDVGAGVSDATPTAVGWHCTAQYFTTIAMPGGRTSDLITWGSVPTSCCLTMQLLVPEVRRQKTTYWPSGKFCSPFSKQSASLVRFRMWPSTLSVLTAPSFQPPLQVFTPQS